MRKRTVEILFVNDLGGGYPTKEKVVENTTVENFLSTVMEKWEAKEYTIILNGKRPTSDCVLENGDQLVVTPVVQKVASA